MKKLVKHLSVHDIDELRRYDEVVEKRIGDYRRKYEIFKYAQKHAFEAISNMTRRQLELGVAVISAVETHAAEQLRMPIEAYCKTVQLQAGKPFVCMTERTNSPSPKWELSIPKLKNEGMENLIAPLLIVGQPRENCVNPSTYKPAHLDDGIHYEDNKHGWTIWFVGEENEDMRLHWLEMCRTETVFRLCLRMPANPVDVSSYGL